MRNNLIYIAILLATPLSSWASSTESTSPRAFIGLKAGMQATPIGDFDRNDPKSGVVGIFGGFQFDQQWSWDIGYQYHGALTAKGTGVKIKTSLLETAVRYDWYIQDNTSLYGRLGGTYWGVSKKESGNKKDANGFSPLAEVGVNYRLSDNWKLSVGYQYIYGLGDNETGSYDSHALLINAAYTFGRSHTVIAKDAPKVVQEVIRQTPKTIQQPKAIQQPHKPGLYIPAMFALNSAAVSEGYSFTALILEINQFPDEKVYVTGYTDTSGPLTFNQKLSEKRATAVANLLVNKGIGASRIVVEGKGESDPIASNRTRQGRIKNRRVEIVVYKKDTDSAKTKKNEKIRQGNNK